MLTTLSSVFFVFFILGILFYGYMKKVDIYDVFIKGAKEGPKTALRIFPVLLAMFVAVSVLRASGLINGIVSLINPILEPLGIDANVLPIIFIRPLSGSGANALLSDIYKTFTPDCFTALLASVLCGSTETTFYVISTYFGTNNITKTRFAISVALLADATGFIGAYIISILFFK